MARDWCSLSRQFRNPSSDKTDSWFWQYNCRGLPMVIF
jgi:hypothetical protein